MPKKASALANEAAAAVEKDLGGGNVTPRLQRLYTGVVHDVMRDLGLRDFTLPHTIRPFTVAKTVAGPVFTLSGRVNKKADAHATLLAWTGFLSKAKAGHVVVIQANDDEVAHMGELSGETLMRKGVPGVIVDGGTRDVEFLMEMGFPVYARYATPRDVVGYWMAEAIDIPVKIGPVGISPGDYVLADRDGIVVLPAARALEIVKKAEAAMSAESAIRKGILSGMDPQEAYLKYGKF